VGVLLDNVPETLLWLEACALAGAALVGLNSTRRDPALGADLVHSDCEVPLPRRSAGRSLGGGRSARCAAPCRERRFRTERSWIRTARRRRRRRG
jgi:hypothetical protein